MYYIFTLKNCGRCMTNKKKLDDAGIMYKEIKITESQANTILADKYNIGYAGTIVNSKTGEKQDVDELVKQFAESERNV